MCFVWAGGLTSRSRPLSGDSLPSGPRSPCARSVSQPPSSDDCLAALVATVIKRLRRVRVRRRGRQLFSRREPSHIFFKQSFRCGSSGDFYYLCTSICPNFIPFDYPVGMAYLDMLLVQLSKFVIKSTRSLCTQRALGKGEENYRGHAHEAAFFVLDVDKVRIWCPQMYTHSTSAVM